MTDFKPPKIPNLFIKEMDTKINRFAMISNNCMFDENLDPFSMIVLTYITSTPPEWNLNVTNISNKLHRSMHLVRKAMKELVRNNYLCKIQKKKSGRFESLGYIASQISLTNEEIKEFAETHCKDWVLLLGDSDVDDEDSTALHHRRMRSTPNAVTVDTNKIDKTPRHKITKTQGKPKGLPNRDQMRKKLDEQSEKESLNLKSANEAFIAEIKANAALWELFTLWYSNVMPEKGKKHFTETKSFQNAVEYIKRAKRGTLFKDLSINDKLFKSKNGKELYTAKIPLEDIKQCIELHIKALLPEYEPVNKSYLKIHLDKFFLNPFSGKNDKGVKSYFAKWMLDDPKPVTPLEEVKDEQLLNSLLEELNWKDKYNSDKNKVIFFINNNHDFLSKLKQNVIKDDKNYKAKAIVEGINKSFLKEITPSLFVNPKLMDWIEEHIINSSWIV
jgi:hypothetical protein